MFAPWPIVQPRTRDTAVRVHDIVAARRVGKMRTCRAASLCRSGWRGHDLWSDVHETSPLPALPNMAALTVVAIPVSDVVIFLGGVLRCRAPWFDGTNEGPCSPDVTGSQLQCVSRGHCPAATPKSGTVGHASLPSVCEGDDEGSGPTPRTPMLPRFPEAGSGSSAPAGLSAEKERDAWETVKGQVCLPASQQRVKGMAKTQVSHTPATNSDAPPVQPVDDSVQTVKAQARPVRDTSDKVSIHDGRSDPTAHSFEEFRLADAGICLATRSEPDVATRETSLGRRTCHPHGEHRMGVSEKGGAAPKDLLVVCCCQRGFGVAFSYHSLLTQTSQVGFHIIAFRTRWMFAVFQEGFVAAFSSDSSPAQNRLWCRFRQPAVRPAPSRLVELALYCQVCQGDASQELVVSTAHWMF